MTLPASANSVILFDFEYTAWEGSKERKWSGPGEHREIIQIAAIRVTVDDGLAEEACFNCLVRPHFNPVLSPYITALTGIQQSAVDAHGISFPEAYTAFFAFSDQARAPLFCYGDDPSVLRENFSLMEIHPALFPASIYDIHAIFEHTGIDTRQYTSGTVHQAVGVHFTHAAHDALNDVRSLAATLRQLKATSRLEDDWLEIAMRKGKF